MPRPREDAETYRRIENWAAAYRGRPASTGYGHALLDLEPDPTPDPDLLDAEVVERVMVRLKASRRRLWPVVVQRFLRRADDVAGAQACRCGVTTYQERITTAVAFVAGALSREAA